MVMAYVYEGMLDIGNATGESGHIKSQQRASSVTANGCG